MGSGKHGPVIFGIAAQTADFRLKVAHDLAAFTSTDRQVQAQAIEREGDQLGRFLKYIIETKGIPPVRVVDGKKRGGLSVLIWSLGSIFGLPFFAHAYKLDEPTKALFGRYLRTVIPFGASIYLLTPLPLFIVQRLNGLAHMHA